jgi:glycosyltransferase involved in cell wall biosynthesis
MKNEMVSVIIPCYNSQDVIRRSVDSVLSQLYQNFEVWVIDDCSDDETLEILDAYEDSRLKVCRLAVNTGSPATPRNIGIGKARGKYIALLDCDDFWAPNKLAVQMKFMKDNHSLFSCTSYIVKDLNGTCHTRRVPAICKFSDALLLNTIGCSSVVIERDLLSRHVFSNRRLEDYDLWLRILQEGHYVLGVDSLLMTYIKSNNSRSKFDIRQAMAYIDIFRRFGKLNLLQVSTHCISYLIRRLIWAKL